MEREMAGSRETEREGGIGRQKKESSQENKKGKRGIGKTKVKEGNKKGNRKGQRQGDREEDSQKERMKGREIESEVARENDGERNK